MNTLIIVKGYLKENSYDGLVDSLKKCTCSIDDLAPCLNPNFSFPEGKQSCNSDFVLCEPHNLESKASDLAKLSKYICYDPDDGQVDYFDTEKEAMAALVDIDASEGFPESWEDGEYFVARITARSAIEITDQQSDYKCLKFPDKTAYCEDCQYHNVNAHDPDDLENCQGTESWGYCSEWTWVGKPILIPIGEDK